MHKIKIFWLLFTLIGFLLNSPQSLILAQQSGGTATIQQVDISQFPQVSFYLEAYDENAQPIAGLETAAVSVLENGLPAAPIDQLETVEPGIQFILAYNLNNTFNAVNSEGDTAYELFTKRVVSWMNSYPENTPDDFSLASQKGLQSIRLTNPTEFASVVSTYEPDFAQSPAGSATLIQALDLAIDPNPNPLMKRSILYVTHLPTVNEIGAFESMINRAVQQDVQVNIWLVAPASTPENNRALYEPLLNLSQATNGNLFLYSGIGEFPNPETYLEPSRFIYQAHYTSVINYAGSHSLTAQIQHEGFSFTSPVHKVDINVQPPNLIVLDPPLTITRDWVEEETSEELFLTPGTVDLNFIIEFPDGYQRPVTNAKLLVNDQVQNQTTSAPFDSILFDLSPFETSQTVSLQIEVQDSLQLITRTAPILVTIETAEKPLSFWQSILQLNPERWIILGSVLTTGVVLVLAIFLVGRRSSVFRKHSQTRKRFNDPVTQPVPIIQDVPKKSIQRQYPQFDENGINAWLVPLDENFIAVRKKAVPLQNQTVTIGRDHKQVSLVLNSKAIENIHATITPNEEGIYWIADNQSKSGTWVNYAPVSSRGIALRHGDLVHFGKFSYRFERQTLEENYKN